MLSSCFNLICFDFFSSLIYLKILFVWAFVMMADFLLDFRFEYFWPSWLLLRSIYDSFRYQGVVWEKFYIIFWINFWKFQKDIRNFLGVFSILRLRHCNIRFGIFHFPTSSMVIFLSQHLRLGAIRLARW